MLEVYVAFRRRRLRTTPPFRPFSRVFLSCRYLESTQRSFLSRTLALARRFSLPTMSPVSTDASHLTACSSSPASPHTRTPSSDPQKSDESSYNNPFSNDRSTTPSSGVAIPSAPPPSYELESSHVTRSSQRSILSSSQSDVPTTEIEEEPRKRATSTSAPEVPPPKKRKRVLYTPQQMTFLRTMFVVVRTP